MAPQAPAGEPVTTMRKAFIDGRLPLVLLYLVPFAIVAAIIAMAMHVTADDNRCTAAGGHLEFAANRDTEECVRDGMVIEP